MVLVQWRGSRRRYFWRAEGYARRQKHAHTWDQFIVQHGTSALLISSKISPIGPIQVFGTVCKAVARRQKCAHTWHQFMAQHGTLHKHPAIAFGFARVGPPDVKFMPQKRIQGYSSLTKIKLILRHSRRQILNIACQHHFTQITVFDYRYQSTPNWQLTHSYVIPFFQFLPFSLLIFCVKYPNSNCFLLYGRLPIYQSLISILFLCKTVCFKIRYQVYDKY